MNGIIRCHVHPRYHLTKYRTALLIQRPYQFMPLNDKKGVKTEDVNGYNGRPIKAMVSKTRTSAGGTAAILEFACPYSNGG